MLLRLSRGVVFLVVRYLRQAGRHVDPAIEDDVQRFHKFGNRGAFQDVAVNAGFQG